MKLFRFMSKVEFEKYKNRYVLINNKIHKDKTNSVGFCFLNLEQYTPEEAMHFLSGIVSFDICAVFETEENLSETYGIYSKGLKSSGNPRQDLIALLLGYKQIDTFKATEYCTISYNKDEFKLVKYSENVWEQWKLAEEQIELKWKEG